ncbi:type 1 glutamine amidotransferase [Williamsia sp. SKLECPSW1]
MMRPPPGTALVLAHEDDRDRGRVEAGSLADALRGRGLTPSVLHPSDDLPDPATVEAVVVLGSVDSAYDDTLPWLGPERAYLARVVEAGTPTLGVCFGGQVLSRVLGGVVARSPRPEVGFVGLTPDAGAAPWIDDGPWMQWHFDHFTLPPAARRLAHNDAGLQAFVRGRVVGTQFHPEITAASFAAWRQGWTRDSEKQVQADFGIDVDDLAARIETDHTPLAARCARLLDGVLDGGLLET